MAERDGWFGEFGGCYRLIALMGNLNMVNTGIQNCGLKNSLIIASDYGKDFTVFCFLNNSDNCIAEWIP